MPRSCSQTPAPRWSGLTLTTLTIPGTYRGRRTRFLYIVTNTFRAGAAAEGFWDTSSLAPGAYVLRIHARDVRGNEAIANVPGSGQPDGAIVEEIRRGYRLRDRVIRPALVAVAAASAETPA